MTTTVGESIIYWAAHHQYWMNRVEGYEYRYERAEQDARLRPEEARLTPLRIHRLARLLQVARDAEDMTRRQLGHATKEVVPTRADRARKRRESYGLAP